MRWLKFKFFLASLAISSIANAQTATQPSIDAFAFEQITVSSSVKILTSATYAPTVTDLPSAFSRALLATITCNDNAGTTPDNQISVRWDGGNPTTSVGVLIFPYDTITLVGYTTITNFKAIRVGTTSVLCNVHYYRAPISVLASATVTITRSGGSVGSSGGGGSFSGNVTQWNGTTVATNAGVTTAGVPRFVLPTDQTKIPVFAQDSAGNDATDTTNHAYKVNVVASNIAAATTVIKTSLAATVFTVASGAKVLDSLICINPDASATAYVQLFNTTSSVTLGTTVPDAFVSCPPGKSNCGGTNINWNFSTGVKAAATTTATNSTAATTALDCTFGIR